jgi:glucose/mannose-6-phosphate isomerase
VSDAIGVLDDPNTRERLDPSGMLSRIEALPDDCEQAWPHASTFELRGDGAYATGIVVLGIGGSAIAGDLLRALATYEGRKPVAVVRGYDLPPNVPKGSLVVACSHSGNTEETLSAFEQAHARSLPIVAVTTGGELANRARNHGLPLLTYSYEGEPRSALGHQLMALLSIAQRTGALPLQEDSVQEAIAHLREQRGQVGLRVPGPQNAAKGLASRLYGRLPVVVGAGSLVEAAHRWRTQFAENSKCWAFHDELPELDHNTIVGFGLPEKLLASLHVVFLRHRSLHPRVLRRYEATAKELDLAGVSWETVEAVGDGPLAVTITGLYFGDFVSYYLALLNGVDPAPVPPIVRLKDQLAR